MSEPREAEEAQESRPARKQHERDIPTAAADAVGSGALAQFQHSLRVGFRELQWREVLLFGIAAGALMSLSFLQGSSLSIIAGIVPVGTGLLLGRRVKSHYLLHGFMTGLIGGAVSSAVLAALIFLTPLGATMQTSLGPGATGFTLVGVWSQLSLFTAFSLIAFCTFGTSMAGRTEERNRKAREEVSSRGGRLVRPGVIRSADDLRGLSLPQLGSYVSNLFKKKGFQFKDYVIKDKYLDLWMEYQDEPWHLRLSVADKVTPGTVESLSQDMKREGCRKGVVVTSMEFLPSAVKSAKGRPIVLIDGQTLYEIAEQ